MAPDPDDMRRRSGAQLGDAGGPAGAVRAVLRHHHRQDDEGLSACTCNNRTFGIALAAVAVGMVGVSFAAIPLYRLFCAVTGYAGTPQIGACGRSRRNPSGRSPSASTPTPTRTCPGTSARSRRRSACRSARSNSPSTRRATWPAHRSPASRSTTSRPTTRASISTRPPASASTSRRSPPVSRCSSRSASGSIRRSPRIRTPRTSARSRCPTRSSARSTTPRSPARWQKAGPHVGPLTPQTPKHDPLNTCAIWR